MVPTEMAQLQTGIPSRSCGSGIAVSVVLQTPLRADGVVSLQIEMAQKLLNSDLAELINKMKLAQQYVMTSLQQEYKKQMLTAAHALAVDAKNLLDVIDQARLKISQSRPH